MLNQHLQLPPSTLSNMHRIQAISGDQVRFVKAPPQPPSDRRTALGEHTDFGSVTILFNRMGGLQVLPPGRNAEWCYVRPLPGHAIVNLGEYGNILSKTPFEEQLLTSKTSSAMVKFTNGLLRSNIHRVVSPPGTQANSTRYSLVYFSRPEDDVMLRRLDGSSLIPPLAEGEEEEEINSKDWIIRRALGKRVGKSKEEYERADGTEKQSQRASL